MKHNIEQFIKFLNNECNEDNITLAKMCMPNYQQKEDHVLKVGKLIGRIEAYAYIIIKLEQIIKESK